ncbi:MAG: hypothetical protein MI756_18155 [Chromatiales bacterium]|nr:hypothetical protein [Chromatiales bacterium]
MSESDKLPEDSELNRLYRSGRHEAPSDALDQAVLSEARRATAKYRNRWIVPLSSAALILLGIGLSLPLIDLDIYDEHQHMPAPAPQAESIYESDQALQKPALPTAPASGAVELRNQAVPAPQADLAAPPRMEQRAKAKRAPEREPLREVPEAVLQSIDREQSDLTPELWLAEIEALIASGQDQAARHSLNGFMSTYPDYPLPESLLIWQSGH